MSSPLTSRLARIGAALLGLIVVGVIALAVLYLGFGVRLGQTGSGRPTYTTASSEAHWAALEKHRAAQHAGAGRPDRAAAPADAAAATAPSASAGPPATAPAAGGNPAGTAPPATTAATPTTAPTTPAASTTPGTPAATPPARRDPHAGSAYWTDFRGPSRSGHYEQGEIRTTWPQDGLRPLWKQPIGVGYASFVVANGRLFTIEQRRRQEVVTSYDATTGQELWTHGWEAGYRDHTGDGPRATPTWHDGRLYALGAEGDLVVLDARAGTPIWRKNILADNEASNLTWGMAASPLIVDDKVIVLAGGGNNRSVVAYHKDTGARVWSALSDKQAYTAPMTATLAGVRQIVVVSAKRAVGVTVDDGRLLWEYEWVTDFGVNASQPIVIGANRLFLSAGYGHGATVIELTPAGDRLGVRTIWQNARLKNKFTSSVLHDGYLYGLDEAILACVDAATGDLKWKGGRYGYGQLILASGHLIVTAENGDLALVRASPTSHQEVARFGALEGKTWNHPALADGRLFVRNAEEMAAFDLRAR